MCKILNIFIAKKWNLMTSVPNYAENFDPFDAEYCHEEVTWLVTMASFFMPEIFELNRFAATMLSYTHGPKLVSYFVANQPHTFDNVLHEIASVKCSDEEGFMAKQRNDAILYVNGLDFILYVEIFSYWKWMENLLYFGSSTKPSNLRFHHTLSFTFSVRILLTMNASCAR